MPLIPLDTVKLSEASPLWIQGAALTAHALHHGLAILPEPGKNLGAPVHHLGEGTFDRSSKPLSSPEITGPTLVWHV